MMQLGIFWLTMSCAENSFVWRTKHAVALYWEIICHSANIFFEIMNRDKYFGKTNRISIYLFIYFMLVGFSFYLFMDRRILPINQWFKLMYNIYLYQYANLRSWYTTPVPNKHGCLDLALDPHRFLSSPLILSGSHSQRIYFVFS